MINLSKTLKAMVSPLVSLIGMPEQLEMAIKRSGKRGNKAHYPSDLTRNEIVLQSQHDVTGRTFEVIVKNGNFQEAIDKLSSMVMDEDRFIEDVLTYTHNENAINFLKHAELV